MVRAENKSTMMMKAMTTKRTRLPDRGGFDLGGQSMECANVLTPVLRADDVAKLREAGWIEAQFSYADPGNFPTVLPAPL
jgi:hypothetical protein